MKKLVCLLMALAMAATMLAGCGIQGSAGRDDGKIQIKVQYLCGRMNLDLEAVLEEKFPNVDIVTDELVGTPDYIVAKEMEYNLEPDIYLYEGLSHMDDKIIAEKFYDLSQEEFVNHFYLSAVSDCINEDGGLYYLPGPVYVYGIVYDKTLFAELGLTVPTNYPEFVQLIQDMDAMNLTGSEPNPDNPEETIEVPVRAFVPTVRWCDMSQIIFNTMNYEDSFRGIRNAKWLADYQKGEGSMVGHMEPAAEKYLKLFEDGVLSLDFWNVEPGYRSRKLYDYHTALMTIESQQAFEFNQVFNEEKPENQHEIGLMPIYTSDDPDSGYLYAIPRSFIGITGQGAADPAKLEALLRIMDYLSTPEGQKLLISGDDYFGFLKNDTSLNSDFYFIQRSRIRSAPDGSSLHSTLRATTTATL